MQVKLEQGFSSESLMMLLWLSRLVVPDATANGFRRTWKEDLVSGRGPFMRHSRVKHWPDLRILRVEDPQEGTRPI